MTSSLKKIALELSKNDLHGLFLKDDMHNLTLMSPFMNASLNVIIWKFDCVNPLYPFIYKQFLLRLNST